MSRVMYDGKRIIPAPFVSINKTYQRSGNGDIIGKTYTIDVIGTIVAYMGSPDSNGDFHTGGGYPADESIDNDSRLSAIQRKQEALRELFSDEGRHFEVQALDGSNSVKCNPRVVDINFPDGLWYDKCEYTITLECDELYPEQEDVFTEYIESASEEWTISTNEQPETINSSRTYALTHTVSAVGKKFYTSTGDGSIEKQAWVQARDFVLSRLGFDSEIALSSGVNNLPSYYSGWNHVRNETPDIQGGGFSVTETWLLASGSAIEDFTIQQSDELEAPYTRVTINGNVTGLESRDSNMGILTTKWDNAHTKFIQASGWAFSRAQTYTGLNLNVTPLSFVVGRNPFQGTIDYSFEYDTRPVNLIENAKTESITISDNFDGELFASVFVLGRVDGPVLQDLSTKPANTRSLSIEIVVDPPTYPANPSVADMTDALINQKPRLDANFSTSLNNLITAAKPSADTVYQSQPQESWDIKTGRYSYNVEWTYE